MPAARRVIPLLALAAAACSGGRAAPDLAVVPTTTGTVYLPDDYDARHKYPVVVMLPASNGTAEAMHRSYPDVGDAIVLVASGTGTTADYATNAAWSATIHRYETQLRHDVNALVQAGRADADRVVLAGFSMGGDLAWALAVRNPELIHGSVIMGSRMSYRASAREHDALRRHHRFAILMGSEEDRTRMAGAQAGKDFLESLDVPVRFREVRDLGHLRAPPGDFQNALEFVLDR